MQQIVRLSQFAYAILVQIDALVTMNRPNVVLIYVDNQPAKMLGCAGNDEIHTPNLDSLASNGIRFSEAYCPNAMCSPCRASVLTGLMPSQHGIHTWLDDSLVSSWPTNWNALAEFRTLPEVLVDDGYDTALVGKYHLGIADEPQNGFNHWVTFQVGHVMSFYDNDMIDNGSHFNYAGHSVEFSTQRAVDYIEQRNDTDEQPFFLFLTYPAPYGHWPSIKGTPTNKFAERYKDTSFTSVPREGISQELIDWMLIRNEKAADDDFEFYNDLLRIPNDLPTLQNYYSQMSMVDEGVGSVLAALERSGQMTNTLVIYTSDHGMSLGEHGFWGHGEDTWPSNTHREANHIPLIVKPPGALQNGRVSEQLVGTTDIFATVMDYVGAESPAADQYLARSLRGIIEGQQDAWSNVVFMEQEETRSVRTPEWLLMKRFEPSSYGFNHELYDLTLDPGERRNVVDYPEYRATVAELSQLIDDFFDAHNNPKWNLWKGGTVKSNSTRPFLWKEVWGDTWEPSY